MRLVLALLMTALLPAQESEQKEMRIFKLKYVSPKTLTVALGPLHMFVTPNTDLGTLTVHAAPAIVRQVEDVVKRFDVPPPPAQNVEVTIYVLSAAPDGSGGVPPELEGVAKQLRATFGFKNVRLLDTQVIRTRVDRGAEVSAALSGGSPQTIASYRFGRATVITDEKGRTIRLDGLKLGMRIPVPFGNSGNLSYMDTGVSTDIDVREGQKAVVGKTAAEGEKTSFFVVMAKVVE